MPIEQQSFSHQEILEFFLDSGIDCALAETPQDRFAETKQAAEKAKLNKAQKPELKRPNANPSKAQPKPIAPQVASVPNEETIKRACGVAREAQTLEDLNEAVINFEGCNLKSTAKHTILGEGNPEAEVMLICDAPGRDEDLSGKPFVGDAGILLDRMLASIGLSREAIYIGHIIPWRPPGNRAPTPFENTLCLPFIERQIKLIKPKHIVLIGASAAKTMLNSNDSIVRLRGKWKSLQISDENYPCISMFHPQYLLRQPMQKKLAWKDLLALKYKIDK
jgi:DNA polymerase